MNEKVKSAKNGAHSTPNSFEVSRSYVVKVILILLAVMTIVIAFAASSHFSTAKSFCNSHLPENIVACIRYENSESIINKNFRDIKKIVREIAKTDSPKSRQMLAREALRLASDSYLEFERLLNSTYLINRSEI